MDCFDNDGRLKPEFASLDRRAVEQEDEIAEKLMQLHQFGDLSIEEAERQLWQNFQKLGELGLQQAY